MESLQQMGDMAVEVMEAPEWSWGIRLAFAVGVLAGLEMLDTAVTYLFENSEKIPAKVSCGVALQLVETASQHGFAGKAPRPIAASRHLVHLL
eukprot:scaffold58_cov256-Pinguiococcus_pyrenoidosus.AAC.5